MRALFIPDDAGNGHIYRCQALAFELEARHWKTYTIGAHAQIPSSQFDLVVIDLTHYIPPIPGIAKTVRIIDDTACQGPCDLMVLGCADVGDEVLLSAVSGRVLVGPRHSLLRQEFRAERCVARRREGVSDARRIVGWSAKALAEQMASSSVVITYAGMRAMEAACVGTPTVLVVRNRGEKMNANGLTAAGAAVLATEAEAEKVAEKLLAAPELLERMGRSAREHVDGSGCPRVADEIEALFDGVR